MDKIEFVGLHSLSLTEHQQDALHKIVERGLEKLKRKSADSHQIKIHVKQTAKGGKQHLYEVHLKVDGTELSLSSVKEDWDIETALHKCFNSLNSLKS